MSTCTWKQARTHEMEDFYLATSHLARVLCAREERRGSSSSEIAKMFLCSFATFHCSVCALQKRREESMLQIIWLSIFFYIFFSLLVFYCCSPSLSPLSFPLTIAPAIPKFVLLCALNICWLSIIEKENPFVLTWIAEMEVRLMTMANFSDRYSLNFTALLELFSVDEGKICRMPYVNDNLWMCIHLNMENFSSSHISETTACFDLLLHHWATLEKSGMTTDLDSICDAMQLELLFLGWFPLQICTYTRHSAAMERKTFLKFFISHLIPTIWQQWKFASQLQNLAWKQRLCACTTTTTAGGLIEEIKGIKI